MEVIISIATANGYVTTGFAFVILAILWIPLCGGLARFLQSRGLQSGAEIPRVLQKRGIALCLSFAFYFFAQGALERMLATKDLHPDKDKILVVGTSSDPAKVGTSSEPAKVGTSSDPPKTVQASRDDIFFYKRLQELIYVLAFVVGFSLWSSAKPVVRIIQHEFIERHLRAYGKNIQRNTASLSYQLIYLALPFAALSLALALSGFDVAAYAVTFGTAALAAVFAVQALLTDVIGGVWMATDTFFAKDDLIKFEGHTYQVMERGIRVTTVRNIDTHEIAYIPNRKLVDTVLVDVTRPTDDYRAVIKLQIPYHTDPRKVRAILVDIANGHPHVIGDYVAKRTAILNKVYRLYIRGGSSETPPVVFGECIWHFIELARLQADERVNRKIIELINSLEAWANLVDEIEAEGFGDESGKAAGAGTQQLTREQKHDVLRAVAKDLDQLTVKLRQATTAWMIHFRNSIARGRKIAFACALDKPDSELKLSFTFADDGELNKLISQFQDMDPESFKEEDNLSGAGQEDDFPKGTSNEKKNLEAKRKLDAFKKNAELLSSALDQLIGGGATNVDKDVIKSLRSAHNSEFYLKYSRLMVTKAAISSGEGTIYENAGAACEVAIDLLLQPALISAEHSDAELSVDATPGARSKVGALEKFLNAVARADTEAGEAGHTKAGEVVRACESMHLLFAVAHHLSQKARIPPQDPNLRTEYQAAKSDLDEIKRKYDSLGELYGLFLSQVADWIATREEPRHELLKATQDGEVLKALNGAVEEIRAEINREDSTAGVAKGVSIALCKTRAEDLYVGALATEHFLDHPLLKALAGAITDYDERRDVSEYFRAWGDRTEMLMHKSAEIIKDLVEARSMTIDTKMRDLAVWLREQFKEPNPAWKYPLAPVEDFGANGVDVSMKLYIDNVRMEKYLRPYHAFTQFRLRILERFVNEGISMPFPQLEFRMSPKEGEGTSFPPRGKAANPANNPSRKSSMTGA